MMPPVDALIEMSQSALEVDEQMSSEPSPRVRDDNLPRLFPGAPLCTDHFVDLCQRLDRLEGLLVLACGRLEAGSCSAPRLTRSKECGSSEAVALAGQEGAKKALDAGVRLGAEQVPKLVAADRPAPAEVSPALAGQGARIDSRSRSSRALGDRGAGCHAPPPVRAKSSASHHPHALHSIKLKDGEEDSAVEAHGCLQGAAIRIMLFKGGLYDVVMGIVICINAIILGLEIQWNLEGDVPSEIFILDNVFLVLFFLDLILRMLANQKGYLRSGWFLLESLLVATGILSSWIMAPLAKASAEGSYVKEPLIRLLMILRSLRLLRLLRALRVFEMFESLWKLCSGLLLSAKVVTCALIVVILFTYIFACFAVEVITQSELLAGNEVTKMIVETRFSSLFRSALTLFAFANADSLSSFYEPLIMQNPLLAPFFVLVWLVLTVSLMNLVTAVIVEEAIAQSSKDIETKRADLRKKVKSIMPKIEKLFDDIDQSGDGVLELAEMDVASIDIPPALEGILDEERLRDLFELLDDDGSGTVDKHEFTDGVISLALQNVPIEATQTLHLLRQQHDRIEDVLRLLEELQPAGSCARSAAGSAYGRSRSKRLLSKGSAGASLGRQEENEKDAASGPSGDFQGIVHQESHSLPAEAASARNVPTLRLPTFSLDRDDRAAGERGLSDVAAP